MRTTSHRSLFYNAFGATALEFAMIFPVLILLIMGIIEYNLIMYASATLTGSLIAAAREGKTGHCNQTGTGVCPSPIVNNVVVPQSQAQYLNCLVGVRVNGLLDSSKLQVSYNDTGSTSFNSSTDSPTFPTGPCTNNTALVTPTYPLCSESSQSAGDIVIYTVTYPWYIATPFLQNVFGTNGVYTLTASAVVKNEPYPSQTTCR